MSRSPVGSRAVRSVLISVVNGFPSVQPGASFFDSVIQTCAAKAVCEKATALSGTKSASLHFAINALQV
jgi:hypothetical protein